LNRAIFLDRDGVINKSIVVDGKPHPPSSVNELIIFEEVEICVSELKKIGFEIVVVTNQPDISRGKTSFETVNEINNLIRKKTKINNFYICPHDELDNCPCRKPRIGLIRQAASELNIDLQGSYMVGDRWRDIEAGQDAGCKCFFINFKYLEKLPSPPFIEVGSLTEATRIIIEDYK
jgi:D-glycero-D-manno-heptose 1,7-bisphosphate phosphatase